MFSDDPICVQGSFCTLALDLSLDAVCLGMASDLEQSDFLQLMTFIEKDSAGICQVPTPPVVEGIIISLSK